MHSTSRKSTTSFENTPTSAVIIIQPPHTEILSLPSINNQLIIFEEEFVLGSLLDFREFVWIYKIVKALRVEF